MGNYMITALKIKIKVEFGRFFAGIFLRNT